MRHTERVHGYLVRNGVRIAIRSKMLSDELQDQITRIDRLITLL